MNGRLAKVLGAIGFDVRRLSGTVLRGAGDVAARLERSDGGGRREHVRQSAGEYAAALRDRFGLDLAAAAELWPRVWSNELARQAEQALTVNGADCLRASHYRREGPRSPSTHFPSTLPLPGATARLARVGRRNRSVAARLHVFEG
jgi:hypothetical protein